MWQIFKTLPKWFLLQVSVPSPPKYNLYEKKLLILVITPEFRTVSNLQKVFN